MSEFQPKNSDEASELDKKPKYPNCSMMLIKYVQDKITPLLQVTQNNDEQDTWDEQVEYFEGVQEAPDGKEVNLVFFLQDGLETYT